MDFYTDGIAGCFWNLISVLCAYVGQFAGIHAWNIPHECILWGSVILCDIVGAIVYVVTRILLGYGFSPYLSTYYILMSMLLALAMCMPEGEVRLYFVLPIRMKWMLILNWYIWDIRWFVYSRSELQVMEPEWEFSWVF